MIFRLPYINPILHSKVDCWNIIYYPVEINLDKRHFSLEKIREYEGFFHVFQFSMVDVHGHILGYTSLVDDPYIKISIQPIQIMQNWSDIE